VNISIRVTIADIIEATNRRTLNTIYGLKDVDWTERCPVALAASRTTGKRVMATKTLLKMMDKRNRFTTYILPSIARLFIETVDRGKPVRPFEFTVKKKRAK
jgi:hypothetical protein